MHTNQLWTNQDWLNGHCAYEEVGKSKYEARSTPPDVLDPTDTTPAPMSTVLDQTVTSEERAKFNQAVLRVARDKFGDYDTFLRMYPTFHQKALLNLMKEPIKPPQPPPVQVTLNWISPDRLSYRRDLIKAIEIDPDKDTES